MIAFRVAPEQPYDGTSATSSPAGAKHNLVLQLGGSHPIYLLLHLEGLCLSPRKELGVWGGSCPAAHATLLLHQKVVHVILLGRPGSTATSIF